MCSQSSQSGRKVPTYYWPTNNHDFALQTLSGQATREEESCINSRAASALLVAKVAVEVRHLANRLELSCGHYARAYN